MFTKMCVCMCECVWSVSETITVNSLLPMCANMTKNNVFKSELVTHAGGMFQADQSDDF